MITYLIMKVIGKCNLGCDYCYYMNDLADPFRTRMPLETAVTVFEKLGAYARSQGLERVAFAWHGGEPTLVGKDYYRSLLAEQRRCFWPDVQVTNLMQTNGTLLDDEWAQLLRDHNFSVGVSIDGSPESHDRHRYYNRGAGSYDVVVRGIRCLVANQVRFGTITVIDPDLDGRGVFSHHYELGIRKMDFNLPITTEAEFERQFGASAVARFSRFMTDVFDAWVDSDDSAVDIRSLASLVLLLLGGGPTYCHSTNSCSRFITVEPNGDVGLCENLRVVVPTVPKTETRVIVPLLHKPVTPSSNGSVIDVPDSRDELAGMSLNGGMSEVYHLRRNVRSHDFFQVEEAVEGKFRRFEFNKRGEICNQCSVKGICNSGCPVHRYREDGTGFENPSFFCEYYKTLIRHISARVQKEVAA